MTIINTLKYLLQLSSTLFDVRCPSIYYVEKNEGKFLLRDENYHIVSHDGRDLLYSIEEMKFIPQEYVIYVNVAILKQDCLPYVLMLREARKVYQLKAIIAYIKQKEVKESYLVKQWYYCYKIAYQPVTYSNEIPTEVDKNAYSYIIMDSLFHIKVRYETKNNDMLRYHIHFLLNEYGTKLKQLINKDL